MACAHSCKGLCRALEVAEQREVEAIKEFTAFAADCDYPDVRDMLLTLIRQRERTLHMLREKRAELTVRFATIDKINDSFA